MKFLKYAVLTATCCLFAAPAFAKQSGINQWSASESKDAITDELLVTAGIAAPEGVQLLFQCSQGHFVAVIVGYLQSVKLKLLSMEDTLPVAWRIDKEPAVTETWITLGKDAALASLDATNFAFSILKGGDKLVFRVQDITSTVPLKGAAEQISLPLKACNIKP
ncbi:hypothetical protein [Thalassospira marina]|uniref:Uncharacterized protein n=1 Tax=Thalassospira marina TaxID=2048283 RepID=A0ABM6QBH0_9PROT|nr:hypothetical protein [Thalassospira marina]AUG53901.1 hypothetical protein CSC3H3_15150 [Thalassospira marina]